MPIIPDTYIWPQWSFAGNHLNISTYNGEIFKSISYGQSSNCYIMYVN